MASHRGELEWKIRRHRKSGIHWIDQLRGIGSRDCAWLCNRVDRYRPRRCGRDQRGARRLGHRPSGKNSGLGYRAVHVTTTTAKELLRAFYGKPARLSFWSSCHEGGNQALTEAQKYPED